MYLISRYFMIKNARKQLKSDLKLGVPEKVTRKNKKYKRMSSNFYGSYISNVSYHVRDEYSFIFEVEYKKDKSYRLAITANGLNLSYSQNGMRMIKEQYGHYTFRFETYLTQIFLPTQKVYSVKEFKEKLAADIKYWNNSGLYNLLLQLYKV